MPKFASPHKVGYETAKKLLKKKSIKKIIDKWERYFNANIEAFMAAQRTQEYQDLRKGFQAAIDEHNDAIRKKLDA